MSAFRYLQERLSLTPSKTPRQKPNSRRRNALSTSVDAPFEKIYHYEVEQENCSELANAKGASPKGKFYSYLLGLCKS